MNRITEMFLLSNHGIWLETDKRNSKGYFGVKFPGIELTELYKWAQWLKCTYMYCLLIYKNHLYLENVNSFH